MISIAVLFVVFALIAFRQIGNVRFQIWQIMLLGAVAVSVSGEITPLKALKSINPDVMLFLFGMFVVGEALEESGYLAHLSFKYFKRAKSLDTLLIMIIFGAGLASAFLMNDTLAIIGTPVVLLLARKHKMHPQVLLLALAFAITIGSVMSPIGNPQNLLIAVHGAIGNPFICFLKYLFVPTLVNLAIVYFLLKWFYKEHFHDEVLSHAQESIKNHSLAVLVKTSLFIILFLVGIKIGIAFIGLDIDYRLTYIALIAAFPILAFSRDRLKILKRIDWHTLIFFASMFILMESVWGTGFFQKMIQKSHLDMTSLSVIFVVSIIVSQWISNVPLVALYLPMLMHAGASAKGLMALAAGSTLAGNLFILGAASNVIIIQNAEKRHSETLTFLEFARIGLPLTLVNALIYWVYLKIIS